MIYPSPSTFQFTIYSDTLIDNLNQDMRETRKLGSSRSHYDVYETKSYFEERTPESKNLYGSTGSLAGSTKSDAHRDYLYQKFGGSRASRDAKTTSLENDWYKSISHETTQTHRSVSPRARPYSGYTGYTTHLAPTATGRPFSVLSRSRSGSPYSSRHGSRAGTPEPILKNRYSAGYSRSVSPKNVHIGPVTEMIEFKRELERAGQQEYYRGRDSRQGKVCKV